MEGGQADWKETGKRTPKLKIISGMKGNPQTGDGDFSHIF